MKRFGQLKQDIITFLSENYGKEHFAPTLKAVYKTMNESKDFKEVFVLYAQIEEGHFPGDTGTAEMFLNEVLESIKIRGTQGVGKVMQKLHEQVQVKDTVHNPIYEAIDTLIYNSGVLDLKSRISAKKTIMEHLTKEKSATPQFAPVNEAVLITLMTSQFNEAFGNISESDKAILGTYLNQSDAQVTESVTKNKETILQNLHTMKNMESGETLQKINETIEEVNTMETNRYNLYKLDNLLKDLMA